jgi:hypothetical protein
LTDTNDARPGNESDALEGPLTVVTIPADRAQAVLDFMASLHSEESDVSGHMLSGRTAGSLGAGPVFARNKYTMTGCNLTGEMMGDYSCTDSDTA